MGYTAGQTLRASQLGPVPVTSATRPAAPHEGQLIVESDTGMVAIYSGSAWRYLAPTGEVSTHAEYNVSGVQSIPNNADTILAFATASTTTSLVTRNTSGVGHSFTLNRAGLWSFSLCIGTANGTGERTGGLKDAAGWVTLVNLVGTASAHLNVHLTRYFGSGTVLTPYLYQNTGGALNTSAGTGETRLHIAWVHS